MGEKAFPLRQVSRLLTEFHAAGVFGVKDTVPVRSTEAIIFQLLQRICLPDWVAGGTLAAPAAPTRFLAVNGIAASLFKSFETTRRYVATLVDRGLAVRGDDGIALAVTPENAARAIAAYQVTHDLFVRFIEDMVATCDMDWPAPGPAAPRPHDVLARAFDVTLRPFDTMRPITSDWAMMMLWIVISNASIRHVTYDPELSRLYAVEYTPDELRRPVPLLPIVQALGLSYTTAARHCQKLADAGLLFNGGNGWIVLTQNLKDPGMDAMAMANNLYAVRKARECIAAGLDPARIGDHYLVSRPSLAPIGR